MKWLAYAVIIIYMIYRTVNGVKAGNFNYVKLTNKTTFSNPIHLSPGVKHVISCVFDKEQQVQWISNNGTVTEAMKNHRVYTANNSLQLGSKNVNTLDLVLSDPNNKDSGMWKCMGGNNKAYVILCVMDPLEFPTTRKVITGQEGQRATITCLVKYDKEAEVTWYANGKIVKGDGLKYRIWSAPYSRGLKSLLRIYSLKGEDAGNYTCSVVQNNKYYPKCTQNYTNTMTLQVYYGPKFDKSKETVYVAQGRIKLACKAEGHPMPTYKWYKISLGTTVDIDESKEENVHIIDGVSYLESENATLNDTLYCAAINIWGRANKEFNLLEMKQPLDISNVTVNHIESNSYNVEIITTVGKTNLMPINEVLVEIINITETSKQKLPPTINEWKKAELIRTPKFFRENGKLKVNLQLPDNCVYWIRVSAANEVGSSNWAGPVQVHTGDTLVDTDYQSDESSTSDDVSTASEPPIWLYGIGFGIVAAIVGVVCMCIMRRV